MKIRIKGNSLRYRLTKSDLANLIKNKELAEESHFLSDKLTYRIVMADSDTITADFINGAITTNLPVNMALSLWQTEQVGFADKSGPVHLLIEKDFTCLDEVEEDQSDNFPNPLAKK